MYADHITNGSQLLFVYIGYLFTSMIQHGTVPSGFRSSTLIPIPKSKRKSMNDSSNYRSIALSSILGKLLDRIILSKCMDVFSTNDMQFGFKKHHSTVQCTMIVNEVINYYENHGSGVYCVLLDASRAFDRVSYIKLFEMLISRNVCPLIVRFLIVFYTSQMICVKWGNDISSSYEVMNGVKQGRVMSPILFIMYMDVLMLRLSDSGAGCLVGTVFCGALGYADDVVLLSPSLSGLKDMLRVCKDFADEYDVLFNSSKSKLLLFGNAQYTGEGLNFMGGTLMLPL